MAGWWISGSAWAATTYAPSGRVHASVRIPKWIVARGSIRAQHRRARAAGALAPSGAVNPDTRREGREQIARLGEFDLTARLDELDVIVARGRYQPPR